MTDHALRVLEYHTALAQLEPYVQTAYGHEHIEHLKPSTDVDWIERELDFVSDAMAFLGRYDLTFGGIRHIRPQVTKAEKDFLLEPRDFLDISDLVRSSERVRKALVGTGKRRDVDETGPAEGQVRAAAQEIADMAKLSEAIRRVIADSGDVLDSASTALGKIRGQIRTNQARIQDRLNAIVSGASYRDALQDPLIVMRNGRYCVPVKSDHKSAVKGIVHDRSASGATLFVEPIAVVEAGNKLAELAIEEREEVERVLRALGKTVAEYADDLLTTIDALGRLDWAFARARYAYDNRANRPTINRHGRVSLVDARHPLLSGDVVPIDIDIGDKFRCVVITGPNTGGKTVTLKTVGLLTLLMQSGIPVTASDRSEMSIFRNVYADIGDEQSIAQSLSTFSSHITNIASMMRFVDARTLILLDEIGAGTDPAEGAALGKALLSHLMEAGAVVLATTHYGELKEFAITHPGIENASVEFDTVTLRPTFRLRMGIPGESNAITIAERLGLPTAITDDARSRMGTRHESMEGVITQLKRDQQESEDGLRLIRRRLKELEDHERDLEAELVRTKEQSRRAITEAEDRATQIIYRAETQVEDAIKSMKKQGTQEAAKTARQVIREARRELMAQTENPATETPDHLPDIAPDDLVQVGVGGPIGRVLDVSDDRRTATVALSGKRVNVETTRLVPQADPQKVAKSSASAKIEMRKTMTTPIELSLRGMRYDEAAIELERYLDDVVLAGYEKVRIVHGKGTGALRKLVSDTARRHSGVKSSQICAPEYGGEGATEIVMKD